MGWPVVLTPQSQDDLREIVSFIASDSPEHGRTFGNILVDKALSIGAHPEMGRVVPEENDPAVREIVHGAYRIIYEVVREPDAVFILRFWHGARGTPQIQEV
jgi:plasmid stabilization system protein ParE